MALGTWKVDPVENQILQKNFEVTKPDATMAHIDANEEIRKKYLEFIIPLLNENKINNLSVYEGFLKGNIYESIGKNYLYNDIHFNKYGNQVIVNELLRKINQ